MTTEKYIEELAQKLGGDRIYLDCACGVGEPFGDDCNCPTDIPNNPKNARPYIEKALNQAKAEGMKEAQERLEKQLAILSHMMRNYKR